MDLTREGRRTPARPFNQRPVRLPFLRRLARLGVGERALGPSSHLERWSTMAFPPMVMLAVSIFFATDTSTTEAAKKEMEALRGIWTIVSIQSENSLGKEIFKEGSSFIIEDSKMTFKRPIGTNPGTLKIDVASNPPTLDFSSQHFRSNHGVSLLDSWLRIQGIYRLKGDSLTICMILQCDASMLSRDRPTDFKAVPNCLPITPRPSNQ